MGEHTGITVDEVKIRRVNTYALSTQGFLCVPDGGANQPSAEDIDNVIAAAIRLTGETDQRFHAVQVIKGTAIYVHPILVPRHPWRLRT